MLLGLILLFMLVNFLLVPSSSLTPLMIPKAFGKGVIKLGWTETLFGMGIIAGRFVFDAWGGFKRKIVTTLTGITGIGAGVILFGAAPSNSFILILVNNLVIGAPVFANDP